MRYLIGFMCVVALAVMGCGETAGTGGSGGDRGPGGSSGEAGMGGSGGGGTGGDGGVGGGAGGSGQITLGLWTGTGDGADGPLTICFNVAYSEVDDRTYLRKPPMSFAECNYALDVSFSDCAGGLSTTGEVRVIDGEFREFFDQAGVFHDISGTFDGNTASGQATTNSVSGGTCSGAWDATPSP